MNTKTRAQRRRDRAHKIKRRKQLLLNEFCRFPLYEINFPDGKLANGHEVSASLTGGRSVKTNTRKSHSRYRFKGGYGPANKYSPHDKRQLLKASESEDKMEKASFENIELGNLMFGNSRGTYAVRPREEYQDVFWEFMNRNDFDSYGYKAGSSSREFENDTFIMRPYYWGEDESIAALPNFVYKPTGFEMDWYKYPLRDAYCNMDMNIEQFKAMLDDCERSLR